MERTVGATLLDRWLDRHEMSQEDLAAQVGVIQSTVSAWKRGTMVPRLRAALALKRIAKIPLEAWEQLEHKATGTGDR